MAERFLAVWLTDNDQEELAGRGEGSVRLGG